MIEQSQLRRVKCPTHIVCCITPAILQIPPGFGRFGPVSDKLQELCICTEVLAGPLSEGRAARRLDSVSTQDDIREFLASRRARITPEEAGLPAYGGNRRVTGLRREEVAMLAGVSVDYYTRLERGNFGGVSESVLAGIARALQLDDAERDHLFDLARATNTTASGQPRRRRVTEQRVRPTVQRILDAMTDAPAFVRNNRRDLLAANRLGLALYSELYADPVRPANTARFVFLNPRARTFFLNWDGAATDMVASLRGEVGREPHDRGLSDLVGELTVQSDEFRTRWAAHNVRHHTTGTKAVHHPVVGDLHLTFESMDLPADPGLALIVYGTEPGSASQDGLSLLASYAASSHQSSTRVP